MKINNNLPKLTIVGAGPGDPELITIKAINAIKSAKVILYDALINPVLLNYATKGTEIIFVGKRRGRTSFKQETIHELILSRAKSHGHIVRLKGGDPFIFGRGAEEMDFARENNIDTEMIPGISSALSVPASQGIPLTRRHVSESFWVITGTTKTREISQDIAIAAQSTATVVILMGMGKLNEIVRIFTKNGKSDMPVSIIQNGTRDNEKSGFGTISNIEKVVDELGLSTPAIIIIGEVVKRRVAVNSIYESINRFNLSA